MRERIDTDAAINESAVKDWFGELPEDRWRCSYCQNLLGNGSRPDHSLHDPVCVFAALAQERADNAAKDKRIRQLEHLLRQGRSILSNPALIKIQGNLPGQVVFGDWSAKVDEAVPENAPAPKEESV